MSWIDVNGIGIETPRLEPPPDEIHEMRATVLFWNDMKQAGIPIRNIAACFGIHHKIVLDNIKQIPEDIKEAYVSDDFVGRLRAAFPKGRRPKSAADLRAVLQGAFSDNLFRHTPLPGPEPERSLVLPQMQRDGAVQAPQGDASDLC